MAERAKLRDTLLKEKQTLEQEIAELKKSEPSVGERREGSPFGKREEEAAEAADMEKRLALELKLNDLMRDVDRALEKLSTGTYGRCDACNELISPERLEALPAAHLCLKCKAAQDKTARARR
ncbi:MAG: TraR/DksA C4-type zinc finger protein [Dehalococcoidia bacterium]|nr:TraR/DksA C4-type zinc finger protein [Dehalococcoidia bacterium]